LRLAARLTKSSRRCDLQPEQPMAMRRRECSNVEIPDLNNLAALTSHATYHRRVNGKDLGFDNYRLTISASVTCSAQSVTLLPAWPVSPASLISCPFIADYPRNFGRVRTSLLPQRSPVPTGFVTAAFSPRPLALPELAGLRLQGAGQQTFKEQIPNYGTRNVCA
jgi:hypothetical protein